MQAHTIIKYLLNQTYYIESSYGNSLLPVVPNNNNTLLGEGMGQTYIRRDEMTQFATSIRIQQQEQHSAMCSRLEKMEGMLERFVNPATTVALPSTSASTLSIPCQGSFDRALLQRWGRIKWVWRGISKGNLGW